MNVIIDTSEYVSNLKQLIEDGHEVVLTVAGWSMEPFLRNAQDRVLLTRPVGGPKPGDIVFYQRKTGQYVLHRVYKKKQDGWYLMGDHQLDLEGPIERDAIFATVTEVERDGRWVSVEALPWKTASGLWRILYPARKFAYAAKKAIQK